MFENRLQSKHFEDQNNKKKIWLFQRKPIYFIFIVKNLNLKNREHSICPRRG